MKEKFNGILIYESDGTHNKIVHEKLEDVKNAIEYIESLVITKLLRN
jgi:hypothetical protein